MTDSISLETLKQKGNKAFSLNNYNDAIELYTQAIEIDPNNAILYGNRALCHLKLKKYENAVSDSNKALELDQNYAKALYRRACAYSELGELNASYKDIQDLMKMGQTTPEILKLLTEVKVKLKDVFFKAISEEKTKRALDLDPNSIVISPSYKGPMLGDHMTLEYIESMICHFRDQKTIALRDCYQIIIWANETFAKLPSLVEVTIPENRVLTVCGDIHGQFYDFLNIFKLNGSPSETNMYLFNGDFVDRGRYSCEVILTMFAYRILYPNSFFLSRGNHESKAMNQAYGFEREAKQKYGNVAYDMFSEAFCSLPLAYVINSKIFVVHGGLSSKTDLKLEDIKKIDRFREPADKGLMTDLLWSDSQPSLGIALNQRSISICFGPDITEAFLENNNLSLMIRSHTMQQDGYKIEVDGKLVTVFSAPNYCGTTGNLGCFIRLTNELKPEYVTFEAVPQPTK